MWRQQRNRDGDWFEPEIGSNRNYDRGDFPGHRTDRNYRGSETQRDRYRESHDKYREDRQYEETDQYRPKYTDEADMHYADDMEDRKKYLEERAGNQYVDSRDYDQQRYYEDSYNDYRYKEERNVGDRREVRETRDKEIDDGTFERTFVREDRNQYLDDRYDNRNDSYNLRQERPYYEDWDDTRNDVPRHEDTYVRESYREGDRIDYRQENKRRDYSDERTFDRDNERLNYDRDLSYNSRDNSRLADNAKRSNQELRQDHGQFDEGRRFQLNRTGANRAGSGMKEARWRRKESSDQKRPNSRQSGDMLGIGRHRPTGDKKIIGVKQGQKGAKDRNASDRKNEHSIDRRDTVSKAVPEKLRSERLTSPKDKHTSYSIKSSEKDKRQSGNKKETNKSSPSKQSSLSLSGRRDGGHRQFGKLGSKTDKVSSKSKKETSVERRYDSKPEAGRSGTKSVQQKSEQSEKSRKGSRDRDNQSRSGRQRTDSKQEAIKTFGSFHEDDTLSILADDDRFANETRTYLGTEDFGSSKSKSVKRDQSSDLSKREKFETYREGLTQAKDKYNHKDNNKKNFNRPQVSVSQHPHVNRNVRNKYLNTGKRERYGFKNVNDRYSNQFRKTPSSLSEQSRMKNRNIVPTKNQAQSNRRENTDKVSSKNVHRHEVSQKSKEQVSVEIGRTGAVLSEDRVQDNWNIYFQKGNGIGKRQGFNIMRKRKDNGDRTRDSGFNTYSKVRKKYLGNRKRGMQGFNKQSGNIGQGFDKGNNRDFIDVRSQENETDLENRPQIEELENQNVTGVPQPNQQVIFIPNVDFQDGHVPIIDQFGNTVINPDLSMGSMQQMPLQFVPSNMATDLPPGSEYVFIPFVNDQTGGISENVNKVNNDNHNQSESTRGKFEEGKRIGTNSKEDPVHESSDATKTPKPLTKAMRNQMRLKLIHNRNKRLMLERRLENRLFARLMKKAEEMEEKGQSVVRLKPTIKRITPPTAGKVKQERAKKQELDDVSADEYDNVSDLEDITDDENENMQHARSRERRQAFRKPGEPRLSVRNRVGVSASMRELEEWESSDVRKVVSRGASNTRVEGTKQNNTGIKRGVGMVEGNKPTGAKRIRKGFELKGNRAISPIQITVNNEKFSHPQNEELSPEDEQYDDRYRSRRTATNDRKSESKDHFKDINRPLRDRGRGDDSPNDSYSGRDNETMSDHSGRKDGPYRQRQSGNKSEHTWRVGKYDERDHWNSSKRTSRFSDIEEKEKRHNESKDNRRSPWTSSPQNQGSNINHGQSQSNQNTNIMSPAFTNNNQMHQSFTAPFSQQPVPVAHNPMNTSQSYPAGFQQMGFNQTGFHFNPDPSLPPVSQGSFNMSPFNQSNFGIRPDMSLPPTAGPLNGTPSSMAGLIYSQSNFPQQNMQAREPLQQSLFPSAQQVQPFQQQQQPLASMNQQMMGGSQFQTNPVLKQQQSFQGNQQSFQPSDLPQFQQSTLQMNSGVSNMKQQHSGISCTLSVANNQSPVTFQTSSQSQQSMQGLTSKTASQQGLFSGQTVTNSSYKSATPAEAMKGVLNKQGGSPVASGQGMRSVGYQISASRSQIVGAVRGGVITVPGTSLQGTGVAIRQMGGSKIVDYRAQKGKTDGNNVNQEMRLDANQGISAQRRTAGQKYAVGSYDDEDEYGELLCMKCDRGFSSEREMRSHSKWHALIEANDQALRCDICRHGFTSAVAYKAHMTEKHSQNSFVCSKCSIGFTNSAALSRHMRTCRQRCT